MRVLAVIILLFALLAWDLSQNGGRGLSAIETFAKEVVEQVGLD